MKVEDISRHFSMEEGRLTVSGLDAVALANDIGTPLFLYDGQTIAEKYAYLRENLPEEVDIFYAMKANPNNAVVKLLVNLGAGVEVASEGELYACRKIGADPKNIVFAGPSKTDGDISMAVEMGIYAINAESLGEIKRIDRIAALPRTDRSPVCVDREPRTERGARQGDPGSWPSDLDGSGPRS